MVVVLIIGILATLAYSSLIDLISTSRAKETAQTMRTFVERALMDGKRQNKIVTIRLNGNKIQYTPEGATPITEQLNSGFSGERPGTVVPNCENVSGVVSFNNGAKSQLKIGISRIILNDNSNSPKSQGYFVACDTRDYCSATVKIDSKNFFVACIKKPKSLTWEAL